MLMSDSALFEEDWTFIEGAIGFSGVGGIGRHVIAARYTNATMPRYYKKHVIIFITFRPLTLHTADPERTRARAEAFAWLSQTRTPLQALSFTKISYLTTFV